MCRESEQSRNLPFRPVGLDSHFLSTDNTKMKTVSVPVFLPFLATPHPLAPLSYLPSTPEQMSSTIAAQAGVRVARALPWPSVGATPSTRYGRPRARARGDRDYEAFWTLRGTGGIISLASQPSSAASRNTSLTVSL